MEFANRRVVVTGGALGIGRGVVEAFAAQGADVLFADVDEETGHRTMENVRKVSPHAGVRFVRADLSDGDEVARFAAEALNRLGRVDVLVNNVGANFKQGDILSHAIGDFEKTLQLNLFGAIRCIQSFLPSMLQSGKGAIVNLSSTMALGAKGFSAYTVSKSGINALTQTLALEYADRGVRFNAVAPGAVQTPATQSWIDTSANPAAEKGIPMKRLGTVKEIADAVLFLASDRASYITGQVLVVDGGLTVGE